MVKIEHRKQQGTILILLGFALIVLLGMAGLVIDLSRLYVNKTELQSALDSCALSAAQELDGTGTALTRAANAGLTAGNANKVNYQKVGAQLVATDITFSDTLNGTYSSNFSPVANAKYAKCTHTTSGIMAYLIQQVGGTSTHSVGGTAVATLAHAQRSCPIPIGAVVNGAKPPNYGYTVGQWIKVWYKGASPNPGEFGIYNLDGSTNAKETVLEMSDPGYCNSKINDPVDTRGVKTTIDAEWNRRFGLYTGSGSPATLAPDFTGYAYGPKNWGPPTKGGAYSDFLTRRASFINYANNQDNTVSTGNSITGLTINSGGYITKNLASGGSPTGDHYVYGRNERIVVVPLVASSSSTIQDYLCMLMVQPVDPNGTNSWFEFLGNASDSNSPCTTNGLPGGSNGPLVAALVQ